MTVSEDGSLHEKVRLRGNSVSKVSFDSSAIINQVQLLRTPRSEETTIIVFEKSKKSK